VVTTLLFLRDVTRAADCSFGLLQLRPHEGTVFDLMVLDGSRAGTCFSLPDVPTVLGRSPEAHLRIDDPWISSMHALFEQRVDGLWVVDLGSRNGTFVDGERVEEARLADGVRLAFGHTTLCVESKGSSGPAEPLRTPIHAEPVHTTARTDRPTGKVAGGAAAGGDADPLRFTVRPVALLRLGLSLPAGGPLPDAATLHAALEGAAQEIRRHGGRTSRLGRAAALAIFGFSDPGPDDAARALEAAECVRAAVQRLAPGLRCRLAIDAGPAAVGMVSSPEGTELVALGEVPDRLERLASTAPAGEILCGPGLAAGPATSR
jgi:pSer/pThr/pTyr-binding forkhead associated (FHA) protein